MSFNIVSAILRGKWLINKTFADSHMPVVFQLLEGKAVSFNEGKKMFDDDHDDTPPPPKMLTVAGVQNVYSVSYYTDLSKLPNNSICMLTIAGPLMKRGGMCSYGMVDHTATISRLAVASNVTGIILNIDSPGGQADGTAMFADAIKNASQQKPVFAIIDDGMAASAAMWIASAANEIYVTQPTDQVGSIGVYTTIADWSTHYKEYFKLPVQDVYAPQSTDKNADYREAINGNLEPLQEELRVLAQQFINTVATNRAGKIKGEEWKTGKMFYAKDAKRIGLIDGIKSFDQVVKRMNSTINTKQNSNTNTMAFEKTLVAAKAKSFEVTDDGFVLSEEQLNSIESTLEAADTSTDTVALEQANEQITTLTQERDTANQQLGAATENLNTANETLATRDARIVELEATVTEFATKSSGSGTAVLATGDPKEGADKEKKGLSNPDHPLNQMATKKVEAAKAKKS